MDPARERELVDRCRREDPGAFEELVDQFKDLVFALIVRTVADRTRAEDLAQDVFLRIHRGLPYFRGEARVVGRVHRASWRREEIVDAVFNAAMIAAALLVAVGLWIALRQTGLPVAVSRDAMEIFSAGMLTAAQKVAPTLPLYVGATGLLILALGLWWWASDAL